jgi:hypothetical protein
MPQIGKTIPQMTIVEKTPSQFICGIAVQNLRHPR